MRLNRLVSVIIPAYNEAKIIRYTVESVREELLKLGKPFEIIIAENGSTDGTDEISLRLSEEYPDVKYLHTAKGRGKALKAGFQFAKGGILLYMDADLSTDLKYLRDIIESIEGECDFAIGSRHLPQSSISGRRLQREIASRGYNLLARLLLRSSLRDHQCGFKAFRREPLMKLIDEVKDEHWFLDTELLVRAQRSGYKVKEIPVDWRDSKESKVDVVRDIWGMGSKMFGLWWEFSGKQFLDLRGKSIASLAVGLAVLLVLSRTIGFGRIFAALSAASVSILLLAALVFSFSYAVRGLRYSYILRSMKRNEGLGFLTNTVLLGQFANLILPSRLGDLVRAAILKEKRGMEFNVGLASLTMERIYDLIAVATLGSLAFLTLSGKSAYPSMILYAAIFSFVLIAMATTFIAVLSYRPIWVKTKLKNIVYSISSPGGYTDDVLSAAWNYVGHVSESIHAPSLAMLSMAFSYLLWTLEVAISIIVFRSLGIDISIALIFMAVSIASLTKIIPTTPGAVGMYEAVLTGFFVMSGISADLAFAAALLDHLVKILVTFFLGLLAVFLLDFKFSKILSYRP